MEMALRLNGSPRPCSKGKVLSLNGHSTKKDDPMKSPFSARIPYLFIGKSARPEEKKRCVQKRYVNRVFKPSPSI